MIGAFWIIQIIKEPEKKVDFMPSGVGESYRFVGWGDKVLAVKIGNETVNTGTGIPTVAGSIV